MLDFVHSLFLSSGNKDFPLLKPSHTPFPINIQKYV